MGVQFHGVTESGSDGRFGRSGGGGGQRPADLVLEPTKEGLDFTLRLLAANRMAKVVQIQCHFDANNNNKNKKIWKLTQQDIHNLFQAIGGTMNDNDTDEDEEEENVVTEDYPPSSASYNVSYRGMPHLESLSLVCHHATDETPSFLPGLTQLVSSSRSSCPQFTRLSLEGVNLRGSVLEVRGLAETVRLHPRLLHWHMQSCYFTPEQQPHVPLLEQAWQEKRSSNHHTYNNNNSSSSATRTTATVTPVDPTDVPVCQQQDDDHPDKVDASSSWWGARLWKSCFCAW